MGKDEDRESADIDKSFQLLAAGSKIRVEQEERKIRDSAWKAADPEGYKKDMEHMCKEMFGDRWQVEYEAMLREEFPDNEGAGEHEA
ncbi:MAG: hypothetical protein AB1733_21560 [Thermodesulfobacteriota bacterium]